MADLQALTLAVREKGAAGRFEDVVAVLEKTERRGELQEVLGKLCLSREGPEVLQHILRSLVRVERAAELQVTVLTRLVREIFRNTCVPNKVASAQLELIQTELERASEPLLLHLVQLCLTELRRTPSETCYRGLPLLGKLLEVASSREALTPDPAEGVKVSGPRYKTRLLEELCALEWGAERVAGLAVMFLELRLGDDELRMVFTKLCSSLGELPSQSLPPLVHQLLLLSRNSGEMAALLLHRLTDFFSTKLSLSERQEVTNPDLESMEIGGSDQEVEDLMQAEGTVVYHLTTQAGRGHPISREVVRLVKAGTKAPEVILHSFSLLLSLALTSARQLEAQLLDLLRLTISCCFQLELSSKDSAWLRVVLPRAGDVSDLLTQVTLTTVAGSRLVPCTLHSALCTLHSGDVYLLLRFYCRRYIRSIKSRCRRK